MVKKKKKKTLNLIGRNYQLWKVISSSKVTTREAESKTNKTSKITIDVLMGQDGFL